MYGNFFEPTRKHHPIARKIAKGAAIGAGVGVGTMVSGAALSTFFPAPLLTLSVASPAILSALGGFIALQKELIKAHEINNYPRFKR